MPRALRPLAIILAFGIAPSCRDIGPELLSVDDPNLPIETSVTVEPGVITTGDTIRVSVTVRNRGARAITIAFGSGCQLGYQVLDSSGEIVSPLGVLCTAEMTYLTLAAAETHSATFNGIGSRRLLDPGTPLPPGEYQVRGGLGIGDALRHPSTPVPLVVQ